MRSIPSRARPPSCSQERRRASHRWGAWPKAPRSSQVAAGDRRRRRRGHAGALAVAAAAARRAGRRPGRRAAAGRRSRDRVSRGARRPRSLRRLARCGSRAAGMDRGASGGLRSDRAQASRGCRGAAGPARATRSGAGGARSTPACISPELERRAGRRARTLPRRGRASSRPVATRRCAAHSTRRVTGLMQVLGMAGGVFRTRIEVHGAAGAQRVRHRRHRVRGERQSWPAAAPACAQVASGGELSRMSLALQVATLGSDHRPCLVFDEVDAGVGRCGRGDGRTAARRARATPARCCASRISPQVAVQADRQLRVAKHTDRGATRTSLDELDGRHARRGDRTDARRRAPHRADSRACAGNARSRRAADRGVAAALLPLRAR